LNNNIDDPPIITINEIKQPSSSNLPRYSPHIISQEAINLITEQEYYRHDGYRWTPESLEQAPPTIVSSDDVDIEHFCAPVVHPITGETISKYQKLKDDPAT
jgi:hypothetical protein